MAVFHPGPSSYTGEDSVEISCHGNPLLVNSINEAIISTGLAIPAMKGEFTLRAYRNGKMDLAQAEAVAALIDSRSLSGVSMARELLDGKLSKEIISIKNSIENLHTEIEAAFILEENEPDIEYITDKVKVITDSIDKLLTSGNDGRISFSGVKTTIAGLPNAGKSSLFNAILGYDRSIVHEEEGTTRDIIREHIEIQGLDFIFHDTAGLRDVESGPETIGIAKSKQLIEDADLLLYVVDAQRGLVKEDFEWLKSGKRIIAVLNKIDLCENELEMPDGIQTVKVSAKYSLGINDLFDLMRMQFIEGHPSIFIERHMALLKSVLEALNSFREALLLGISLDAAVMDIMAAVSYLNAILGIELDDDILNSIFSRFCVGK